MLKALKLDKYIGKYYKYCKAWKYRRLARWIRTPPTQEYVLPMFFQSKPSILLWLSRKFHNNDLTLYAQYFHPSYLVESTMKHNFMKYHTRLYGGASPPPWFETKAEKCELYQCSKIIEALLGEEHEKSNFVSAAPMSRKMGNYEHKYANMLDWAYEILHDKYKRENPGLIEVMNKEKVYMMENITRTRDEKRELELLRRAKLQKRIEDLQKIGVPAEQTNLFKMVLDESKDCYTYYTMFKEFLKLNQPESSALVDTFSKLGLDKVEANEKSAMPADEQFCMKFDELYGVTLEKPKIEAPESDTTTQTIAANL
eukprot:TRINITY_DN70894_c3_g1_i1.p1 TRINITY_DN70894_c3_g1~~TRINITY_DN70894_c3_g1_i1.p1  ORF type:complete len:313 (-),score=41.68 TRINITY_DN70894_c3_g1_i1:872-1810(-)